MGKVKNSVEQNPDNAAQTCGSCSNLLFRTIRQWFPINFWQEVKNIFKLAVPVVFSRLMVALITIVNFAFSGHLGKTELAAVSLAFVIIGVLGISVGIGLCMACDTLISQTYGSKNLKRIGVILQRGTLILLIACFPCWAFFVNTEHVLLALKQPPQVAKLAQLFVLIGSCGLPAVFLYQLELRYLHNQGITIPQLFVGFITNVLNVVINYLFAYVLKLGVAGLAAANITSQYCQTILLFGYIRWKKLHVQTWAGWSTGCLQEWGNYLRLAIPSMLMICSEWWAYDIGTFLVGLISEVELGAQTIVLQFILVLYRIPLGFGMAATVYVGNALGAGNPQQAVNSAKVAVCCTGFTSFIIAVVLGAAKSKLAYIFTNDKDIVDLVSEVVPLCAAFHLFEAIVGVCFGVLRGAGKQKLGAFSSLVGYYLIGFPVGIPLMFAAKCGIFGLWYGMLTSVIGQLVFFLIVFYRFNWNEACSEALVNAGVVKNVDTSHSASGCQTQYRSTDVDTRNRAVNPIPNVCQSEIQTEEDRVMDTSSTADTGVTSVGEILSTKQLIIRRGLAFLSGPVILAIGLTVHFILSKDM
ncbi:multidrug and toxin extrusion protein 1-like isoform X1 [Stegostoma tigrinum]|uniref:multidrug and toxin extrusion protein 1-like isoform X1 n=2 Tax=Stegostoma tigrinum TaxID=3053191 RepID=UPI00287036E5|nr:multidrug and toxin extrusion protein 1-like isoform X1 [Stegostoma tigrinum]